MAEVHRTETVLLSLQDKKDAEFYQKDFLRQVEKDLTIDLDEIRGITETIDFDPSEIDKVILLFVRGLSNVITKRQNPEN